MPYPQDLFSDSFRLRVAAGLVPGVRELLKFGRNPDVDIATEEDIWTYGGTKTYLDAAETISVVSDSAEDATGLTGTYEIILFGLDNNFDEITEVITPNGLTPVVTTQSFRRLFRMVATKAGSAKSNVGNITATASTSLTVQAYINAGNSQTEMTHYTVPAGHTAFMTISVSSVEYGKSADLYFDVRDNAYSDDATFRRLVTVIVSGGVTDVQIPIPEPLTEKIDLRIRASCYTNQSSISSWYQLYVIDNKFLNNL